MSTRAFSRRGGWSTAVAGGYWSRSYPHRPLPRGAAGWPRWDDRFALEGVLFVLTTGIGWARLPPELGVGFGWTCWRLGDWQNAGVWDARHHAVLDELGRKELLDWSQVAIDSVGVRAKRGG